MTLTIESLALTPKQAAELNLADAGLVGAWLEATSLQRGLKSPAGFFLAGVRSGAMPARLEDERERRAVAVAEARVRNIGYLLLDEAELLSELFTSRGSVLEHHDSPELRARMLAAWSRVRPAAPLELGPGSSDIDWTTPDA